MLRSGHFLPLRRDGHATAETGVYAGDERLNGCTTHQCIERYATYAYFGSAVLTDECRRTSEDLVELRRIPVTLLVTALRSRRGRSGEMGPGSQDGRAVGDRETFEGWSCESS